MDNKRKKNTIALSFVVIVVLILVIRTCIHNKNLIDNHRYSVAEIYSIGYSKSGPAVAYRFLYGDKIINGSITVYDDHSHKVGQKFLVVFSTNSRASEAIQLDIPIADSIQPPKFGWKYLPSFLLKDSSRIELPYSPF